MERTRHELTSNSPDTAPIPSWGWVVAGPSEYLVVYRKGAWVEGLSGQGARVFKRRSDAVAIVPTTLKEVVFEANQITVDQVDVRVRGMLLYRITDPARVCALINFTRRQAAEAKLARMIGDMCRSTVKWLVANMTLEECNRRRKEEIANTLKREVAAVATEEWGVEIVTIDIQDVYVQDAALFESMQATFKAERRREAELAQLVAERTIEQQRLANARETAREQHDLDVERVEREGKVHLAELEQKRAHDLATYDLDAERLARNAELQAERERLEQARARQAAEAQRALAEVEAETRAKRTEQELEALRARLAVEDGAGRGSLERLLVREALPRVADVLGDALREAQIHLGSASLEEVLRAAMGRLAGD